MVITQRETSPQLQLHGAGPSLQGLPSQQHAQCYSNAFLPCMPATTAERMHICSEPCICAFCLQAPASSSCSDR